MDKICHSASKSSLVLTNNLHIHTAKIAANTGEAQPDSSSSNSRKPNHNDCPSESQKLKPNPNRKTPYTRLKKGEKKLVVFVKTATVSSLFILSYATYTDWAFKSVHLLTLTSINSFVLKQIILKRFFRQNTSSCMQCTHLFTSSFKPLLKVRNLSHSTLASLTQ